MDVDGTTVCLNTNIEAGKVTTTPDNIDEVHQLFVEDMDQDGNMDIVTNDKNGDVKIFYGGQNSQGQ